jgi:hypothetical protein
MYTITANQDIRDIMERAHAERNAAVRAFFASIFMRKTNTAPIAAQAA